MSDKPSTMSASRTFRRELATTNADAWARATPASKFAGEMRVETRNTIYMFKDGACTGVTRGDRAFRADPTTLVGMRFLGWLADSDARAGLRDAWQPGAYAVLWRPRRANEAASSVALTSAVAAFTAVRRSSPPPVRPRPKSMTRMNTFPPPLPTSASQPLPRSSHAPIAPTPARASASPPPLPARRTVPPPLPARRTVPPPLPARRTTPPPLPNRATATGSHASA
jgi:hypothetical protein